MAQPALPIVIQAIDRATSVLAKVRADVVTTAGTIDGANARMGKSTRRGGQEVARGTGAMRIGYLAAGVAALGSAVAAGKFNFTLRRVGVFANATAAELQNLRRALLAGTQGLQILPTEAAETAEQLAKVGLSAGDIAKTVIPTLELMIAAGKELGPRRAAKVMFQGMTLFGKGADEAREIASGLAATFAGSALDANKLSVGFQILSTGTTRLRGTFEDTSAILGLIANIFPDRINRGVRSAARLFEDLSISTRRAGFEGAFGVSVLNKQGTGFRRVRDIVTDVTEKLLTLNPVQRAARIEQSGLSIESQRALGFFVDLAKAGIPDATGQLRKGAQVFKVFGDRIENQVKTGGALNRLQSEMGKTLPDALKKLGGGFQRLGIALGTKIGPELIKFMRGLTRALDAFAAAIENLGPGATKLIGWTGTLLAIMLGLKGIKGLGKLFAGLLLPRGLGGALLGRGVGAAAVGGAAAAGGGVAPAAAAGAAGAAAPSLLGKVGRFALKKVPLIAAAVGTGLALRDLFTLQEARRTGTRVEDLETTPFVVKAARALGFAQGVTNRQEKQTLQAIEDAMVDLGIEDVDLPGIPNQPGPERAEALLGLAEGAEGLGGAIKQLAGFAQAQGKAAAAAATQNITLEVDREVLGRVIREAQEEHGRIENGARFTPGF